MPLPPQNDGELETLLAITDPLPRYSPAFRQRVLDAAGLVYTQRPQFVGERIVAHTVILVLLVAAWSPVFSPYLSQPHWITSFLASATRWMDTFHTVPHDHHLPQEDGSWMDWESTSSQYYGDRVTQFEDALLAQEWLRRERILSLYKPAGHFLPTQSVVPTRTTSEQNIPHSHDGAGIIRRCKASEFCRTEVRVMPTPEAIGKLDERSHQTAFV